MKPIDFPDEMAFRCLVVLALAMLLIETGGGSPKFMVTSGYLFAVMGAVMFLRVVMDMVSSTRPTDPTTKTEVGEP